MSDAPDAPSGHADAGSARRRAVMVGTAVIGLLAGAAGVAWGLESGNEPTVSGGAPATTVTTIGETTTSSAPTTTTTTTTTSTTTATLPLEQTGPIAPPADPRGAEDAPLVGSIAIPKIGLDVPMRSGIRMTTLDRGPGHWPGTAMPGEVGNVVVAAHRTSYNAEFRYLDVLVPGDEVVFTTDTGVHTYRVTGTQIVQPDALWITDPTDTPTATLFACHPLGSTAQRIVVNLELAT